MFVEKIILDQLSLDGRIETTILQNTSGEPFLIDYSERLSIDGEDVGPYIIIKDRSSKIKNILFDIMPDRMRHRRQFFFGDLTTESFKEIKKNQYVISQKWMQIPVGANGCGIAYGLQLPQYSNIDHIKVSGDGYDAEVIRDQRIKSHFISKLLRPDYDRRTVSIELECTFTIDSDRFDTQTESNLEIRTHSGRFEAHDSKLEPIIGEMIESFSNAMSPIKGIFLSHRTKDKHFVERIAAQLLRLGEKIWFDKLDIHPGDSISHQVGVGIEKSDIFAIFLSNPSQKGSKWVDSEFSTAFYQAQSDDRKLIIPILLEDCEIPPMLKGILYIDARNGDPRNCAKEIIKAATNHRMSAH